MKSILRILGAVALTAASVAAAPLPTRVNADIPKRAMVGYLHASFANGSGYIKMADVPDEWDIIELAFGEPTEVDSGDIRFNRCGTEECPEVETDEEFLAAVKKKQEAGKKVLISIGGELGQVQLKTTEARDKFVSSVSAIIDKWGLDGLDVDFEGHSLSLDEGDEDFTKPTTPVIVNLIDALRSLKEKYADKFTLTMAPETFFVQLGYTTYGGGNGGDARAGAYLPVIHAMRDDLTILQVQLYNSGPITGLDDQFHNMGAADFLIAMTDMLVAGFPVAKTGKDFPALKPEQIALGVPAGSSAGNGFVAPEGVQSALGCLVKGTDCGGYELRGGKAAGLRGLMTWSMNWDKSYDWAFMKAHRPYLDGL